MRYLLLIYGDESNYGQLSEEEMQADMQRWFEYTEQMRSEIADLVNTGGRPAGACTAAVFLKEFAGSLPWAHLDIAGTAWADDAKPWQPKGPTGVAVRTLAELALSSGEWA